FGNPWLFALAIFGVNVVTVAVLRTLLPSMIVPFAGVAVFAHKAYETGVVLAPVDATVAKLMIPHSLTLVIEFQAYALVMLGAYLLGKAWLRPAAVGAPDRRRGYLRGLQQAGWLTLPALALFVIGAIYEAFSLIFIAPPLVAGCPPPAGETTLPVPVPHGAGSTGTTRGNGVSRGLAPVRSATEEQDAQTAEALDHSAGLHVRGMASR